jgi:hypothetical protein
MWRFLIGPATLFLFAGVLANDGKEGALFCH